MARKIAGTPASREGAYRSVLFWGSAILTGMLLGAMANFAFAAEAPNGEAAKDVWVRAPMENVDGSPVTDLATLRLWWAFDLGDWVTERSLDVPFTEAGGVHQETATVQVVGEIGDEVTVFYTATAIDEHGNQSGFATAISETFEIVDATVPLPPEVFFSVPVTRTCRTPEGAACGLVPVS